jgi:hypothetical protein
MLPRIRVLRSRIPAFVGPVVVAKRIEEGVLNARIVHNNLRFLFHSELAKIALLAMPNPPHFESLVKMFVICSSQAPRYSER